ncbi:MULTISPECIES: ectoine/hydroxyectoine ABC transporter permease subunit EhuC [Mycolicibacterium]|uniref:ectoine/hydroxyectoine ABC transporter permease subunit EhuC n=1 Tax=Mycolicibacterium TaxID=1866885 RepID=UPI001E2DC63A|nr:ectoine/hydroxyectoine ABC transporter permease subunit EhuC [Mycolicibacterium mageritense]MBN3456665.1 ectoine/hydroxyectoine ABC transporter permease subunit EhuC [Mycobacterium sp. DSM 3803]GJJ23199.1 ectoine/hydroxyectoine ABC transporter permease subunit EhuC [Mycolicibacterium mageritense]
MFDNIGLFVGTIADGLLLTVEATVGGIVIATVLSFAAGLAMVSRSAPVRAVARCYVEIWRGTSEMVQLLWIYFVLPILVGYQIVPLAAGILVLGLNHGAYGAEIVRGAIQSVPRAQYEGCVALNFTRAQRMRRVILPQALPEMVPPFNNLFIQLLKGSSLLTVITVHEMTYQAREVLINNHISQAALIWTLVLLFYLALAIVITYAMRGLERRTAARVGRRPAPRRALAGLRGAP